MVDKVLVAGYLSIVREQTRQQQKEKVSGYENPSPVAPPHESLLWMRECRRAKNYTNDITGRVRFGLGATADGM